MTKKVIHYLNQFFGQLGGEQEADRAPIFKKGPIGPGTALTHMLSMDAEIVGTVIAGDNYAAVNGEALETFILQMIQEYEADLLIAGPAFQAGRYGMACIVALQAADRANIPAVAGLHSENPAVAMYRGDGYIVPVGGAAAQMKDALEKIARLAQRLLGGESFGDPATEGYLPRGMRKNVWVDQTGAARGVDMLLQKIKGAPYETEYRMPVFSRVIPSPKVSDIRKATIAVMTTGGIVPKGNPDHLEACFATRYARYTRQDLPELTAFNCESVHGGYDPTYANEEPNRVLPVDVMFDLERDGEIGCFYPDYYVTVGNGMAVGTARALGREIAEILKSEGVVDGVILTST
jgi:glycine reductase complex component B subunit gamma